MNHVDVLVPGRRTARHLFVQVTGGLCMVELRGFEPLTFSLRTRRATNCATAPCARRRDAKIHEQFGAHPIAPRKFHSCEWKSIRR